MYALFGDTKHFREAGKRLTVVVAKADFLIPFTLGRRVTGYWSLRERDPNIRFKDHAARGIRQLLKYGCGVKAPMGHIWTLAILEKRMAIGQA